ncbi:hypothetical protein SAMN05660226_01843 [Parapedobacter luteus]|uniref:Uncharacterized protein n=2 Tax=Parapedobacter TaxID=416949 RepID=A0A1T5BXP5_9SPHI|nr:hypothetical protein [Parapedobacter luteus]SKB51914.1 hypothetical protein SAMN05660226_01843 [Parapedobacter luteus]
MRTVTLEILNDKAMSLLRDLEQLKLLRFRKDSQQATKQAKKKVTFDAVAIDTTGFKFDRDEANER